MNQQQSAGWQGTGGNKWVEAQELLDQMFQPIEDLLMQWLPADARRLLDVGCGTGATTLAAARRLGPDSHCTGIDISGPVIAAARDNATLRLIVWRSDIEPLDVVCSFPEKELLRYITRMGPVGRLLQTADDHTRQQVAGTARAAFEPFVHGDEVRYTAACWDIRAGASDQR
jgi:SAM-dependent methyltransferase